MPSAIALPRRQFVAGGAAALLLPGALSARDRPRGGWMPDEAAIAGLMAAAHVPGVQIAVAERGRVVWKRGFGRLRADRPGTVTSDTLFEAASMTKPVAAWLIMRLVDEGRLALDAPLARYVRPDYLAKDDPALDRITVRDALLHTSGLPNWGKAPLRTTRPPGREYTYSGEAYVWLQQAAEAVTDQGFGVLMRDRLFRPAGMTHSHFGWDARIAATAAWGHDATGKVDPGQEGRLWGERLLPIARQRGKPIAEWTTAEELAALPDAGTRDILLNAGGGLFTTARDYARFMTLMADGSRAGGWGLSGRTKAAMLTPALDIGAPGFTRGLGWQLETHGPARIFEHSGSNYGIFKTLGVGDATTGRAIVVFTNGANGTAIAQRIVRQATGLDLLKFRD